MIKTIYLVRHGNVNSNVADAIQGADEPLNEFGILQAGKLADRLSRVSFDTLVTSDILRAEQTAQAVAQATGHAPIANALFREIREPSQFIGTPRVTPEVKEYYRQYIEATDPNWKYSDDESFAEMKNRAVEALSYIESLSGQAIAVVTHGHFMRLLVATMMFGSELSKKEWMRIELTFKTINTGVTVARRLPDRWQILTWNDHAHLAE